MKPGGMFLDTGSYGNEFLFDEFAALPVLVGLGGQSSTGSSSGCRAKVNQDRPVLRFRFRERLIDNLCASLWPCLLPATNSNDAMPRQGERRGRPILSIRRESLFDRSTRALAFRDVM
jgi:hypothetical protein